MSRKDTILILLDELEALAALLPADRTIAAREKIARYRVEYPRGKGEWRHRQV